VLTAACFNCVLKFPVHLLIGESVNLSFSGVGHTSDVDAAKETRKRSWKGWLISVNIVLQHWCGMKSGENILVNDYCQNRYFQLKKLWLLIIVIFPL